MSPKNMLVYAATEAEILRPSCVRDAARTILRTGFESVYLEFRNVKAARTGQRFDHGMREIVRILKEEGLYVAIEASFNNLDSVLLEEAPEAFTDSLHLHRTLVKDGVASLTLSGDVSTWSFPFAAVVEWIDDRLKIKQQLGLGDPTITLEGGGCAMTRHPGRTHVCFEWKVPSVDDGCELVIVTRKHHEYVFKDLGHPELLRRLPGLLASRAASGADELFLDEPHFGFAFYDHDGRAISDRLLQEFESRFGYRLNQVFPSLWFDCEGVEAPLVRLHYAELLEGALETMESVILQTREQLAAGGVRVRLGGHRTMHEELSDDVLIGCSDYFRHDFATTASYTDSVFERPDSMATMGQLARSLAARSSGREAWNMSWGFNPTPSQQSFYARLLGAMKIRWCLHAWNDSMMFGPGFPNHPCWSALADDLVAHRSLLNELEGWVPSADTLVLYNWRAAAAVSGALRHVQRRAMILLAWTFTRRSVPFLFVDADGLGTRLEDDAEIKRVVLHWPEALPANAWRSLCRWVNRGGHLTLIGPKPSMFCDGSPLDPMVADLLGVRFGKQCIFSLGDRVQWLCREFHVAPELLSPRISDAPASTWTTSWPIETLDLADAEPVVFLGQAVVAAQCRRGEGVVTTATFEPSYVPGLIEQMFGLPDGPTPKAHLHYRRGGERKTVSLPWVDDP